MIITRGDLKGRGIVCPSGIRPVSSMVRKACFDIISQAVDGARVLDLYAGSGALGVEALSAGAKEAVFVDIESTCLDAIKKNISLLGLSIRAEIYLKDSAKAVLDFYNSQEKFDFIFIDPPYYKGILRKILQEVEVYDILAPSGYIVGFCYIKDEFLRESSKFSLTRKKKYGQTYLLVYEKNN